MLKNLKSYIYNDLLVSSNDIKNTIEAFSAYLDEFDKEYKYNFKFLTSHIEDFERSIKVHNLFKNQCFSIVEELRKDSSINEVFAKVLMYKERLRCNIEFNSVFTYSIKEVTEIGESWDIKGTLKQQSWEKTIENNGADINISIDLHYDNEHFSKRFFNVDVRKMEHVGLIKGFFNESYKSIILNKLGVDILYKLKTLRCALPDNYEVSVIVDDLHSLCISRNLLDNYLDNSLLSIERNASMIPGAFFVSLRNKKYKFVKSKLDNIEKVVEELMNLIQAEDEHEQ